MSEIIYLTKCGCEIEKSGTFRSREGRTTRVLCRKHKQPIMGRKQKCQDCGKWFMLKDRGPGSIRCPECALIALAQRRRESPSYTRKPRGPAARWSVDKRGDYCRWLPSCKTRECVGCREFTALFRGVDPEKYNSLLLRKRSK